VSSYELSANGSGKGEEIKQLQDRYREVKNDLDKNKEKWTSLYVGIAVGETGYFSPPPPIPGPNFRSNVPLTDFQLGTKYRLDFHEKNNDKIDTLEK
jgi:hypothetical protein